PPPPRKERPTAASAGSSSGSPPPQGGIGATIDRPDAYRRGPGRSTPAGPTDMTSRPGRVWAKLGGNPLSVWSGPVSAPEPVRFAALTDVGVKRSHNQDACAANPAADAAEWETRGHVFVVADGMGGHAVGEKASAKAVRDIPHLYQKHARDGVIPALRRAFQ